jgi:hypothetical protein
LKEPFIIKFPKIGTEEKGFLVPFEHIPFPIEHVYCIGPVPEGESRGNHAKKTNTQVLIAVGGSAVLKLESPNGLEYEFTLNSNDTGLLIPAGFWRSAILDKNCFLLGLHSIKYSEEDYIRDYSEFKKLNNR